MDSLWSPLELIDVAINMTAAEACYLFPAGWLLSIVWVFGIVGLTLLAVWSAGFALRRCLLAALIVLTFLMLVGGRIAIGYADDQTVDANVITGLDVSSSINAQDTRLQIEGMAEAIRSPQVVEAVQHGQHHRIGFLIFLWADGEYPEIVAWRTIGSQAEADAASAEILARLESIIAEASQKVGTLTNLSGALDHAADLIRQAPYVGDRTLVNIVGNGEDNVGEDPAAARAKLLAMGAAINGVVIGGDPAVMTYYRTSVIGGRASFVRAAAQPADLVGVMISKFVSEIALFAPKPFLLTNKRS